MTEPTGWWTVGISAVALAVSVITAIVSLRTSARATRLQERMLSLENVRERDRIAATRKAAVVAFIASPRNTPCLYVRNEGESMARAIAVTLDSRPYPDHPLAMQGETLPETLSSLGESHAMLRVAMGSPTSVRVRIRWEDESGQTGDWESDLRVI